MGIGPAQSRESTYHAHPSSSTGRRKDPFVELAKTVDTPATSCIIGKASFSAVVSSGSDGINGLMTQVGLSTTAFSTRP